MKNRYRGVWMMSECLRCFFLLFAAILVIFTPAAVQAAGCMDGKLSCSLNYLFNDTQKMIVKSAKIDYHPIISPSVTTRIECNQVSDGTTDLYCTSNITYAYVYYVKSNTPKGIKNPGYSATSDLCEKLCGELGIAVYYLNGGPL